MKTPMNIYVASSWRNKYQQDVVQTIRNAGFNPYDFKNPGDGNTGFAWSEIDVNWKSWTPAKFRHNLGHPLAVEGFALDYAAMLRADAFVLVLPCGRSAHLELGWAVGMQKPAGILLSDGEPELMYRLVGTDCLFSDIYGMLSWLREVEHETSCASP